VKQSLPFLCADLVALRSTAVVDSEMVFVELSAWGTRVPSPENLGSVVILATIKRSFRRRCQGGTCFCPRFHGHSGGCNASCPCPKDLCQHAGSVWQTVQHSVFST